jgi:hypothetical protein
MEWHQKTCIFAGDFEGIEKIMKNAGFFEGDSQKTCIFTAF